MTHLSADERLVLIEARESPRHPHLDACERCRGEVARARAAIDEAREVEVPEPSPLFWAHFSARVSAQLRDAPRPVERPWKRWAILVPLGAAVLALVTTVAVERGGSRRAVPAPVSVVAADTETPGAEAAAVDEAWDMLGDLAGEFDVETLGDSLGSSLSAGADSVVWQLDDNERAELTRLLRAELQPHGSGS